jgi:hypothetical protein
MPLRPTRWEQDPQLAPQPPLQPLHLVRPGSQHRCPRDSQQALSLARLALQLLALVARYPAGLEGLEAHRLVQVEQRWVPAQMKRSAEKAQDG